MTSKKKCNQNWTSFFLVFFLFPFTPSFLPASRPLISQKQLHCFFPFFSCHSLPSPLHLCPFVHSLFPPPNLFSYSSFPPSFHSFTHYFTFSLPFCLLIPVWGCPAHQRLKWWIWRSTHHHCAAPALAAHAADGSYPVHLVSEAATPRRGPPFLVCRFVFPRCGLVVKETSPHPPGAGVHA